MVNNINCMRYTSDLANMDFIIVIEDYIKNIPDKTIKTLTNIIENIIENWFNSDICDTLQEYIIEELKDFGLIVSIYNNMED